VEFKKGDKIKAIYKHHPELEEGEIVKVLWTEGKEESPHHYKLFYKEAEDEDDVNYIWSEDIELIKPQSLVELMED